MTLAQIMEMMKQKNIKDPLRFTAVFSDGEEITAIRFSSDELAPSLYCKQFEKHIVIGSEPLDHSSDSWTQVPAGHIAKIKDQNYRIQPLSELLKMTA
jgi:glutamine amidotransferase